jgi:potassium/hydrogen antiporter
VPIVFATYPLLAGIDKADMIFNIVFFVAVSSVLVQGNYIGNCRKMAWE